MDIAKRNALVERLSGEPEPQIVPVDEFFDGNDDLGSIGCNLIEHPGIGAFRSVLARISQRPDISGVYAQIAEVDPGADSWPFADTVLFVGTISVEDLTTELSSLEPDEVGSAGDFVPEIVSRGANEKVMVAWWD